MDSTTLICKRCKAPLEYEEGSAVLNCPHCGYSEKIDESDPVTIARIRAKLIRDTELGKKKIEKDAAIEGQRLNLEEKNLGLKKIKIILAAALLVCIAILVVFAGYKIKHKDEIKMPLSAAAYCQRNYEDTYQLLKDAGFEDIEYIVQDNLSMNERKLINIVTQVSINGNTSFNAGSWFSKSSTVKITYRDLDPSKKNDVEMPISSMDCPGKNHQIVADMLKAAGFQNIQETSYADLAKDHQSDDGKITHIYIGNNSAFYQGEYYAVDAPIQIEYHTMDPERVTDIEIPDNSDSYVGRDCAEVRKEFQKSGFSNITLVPKYDLSLFRTAKKGEIQSIAIKGSNTFSKGTWVPTATEVTITYHAEEVRFVDKNYQDVIDELKDMGFNDISSSPLGDLGIRDLKKSGKVESVLIEGADFEDATELNLLTHIDIRYHSEQMANDAQVKITTASKDLVGENYQTVIDALQNMGFTNVKGVALGDLKKGWFAKENTVKSVAIGNATKFSVGDILDRDIDVIVSYHSFP